FFDLLPFAAYVISARAGRPLTSNSNNLSISKRLAKEYSPIPRIDWKRKPLQIQVKKLTFNRFLNLIEILIASKVESY
ncbi:unnamed protein product, partial [Brassica rapa subsp. trilocularis]